MQKQHHPQPIRSRRETPGRAGRYAAMALRPVAVSLSIALAATAACAQTPDLDAARVQALEMQLQAAQQRALEAERQATSAQDRLRTEQALDALAAGRAASSTVQGSSYAEAVATPSQTGTGSNLMGQLAADNDRIMQLQQQAMERSNARILAVRPAL